MTPDSFDTLQAPGWGWAPATEGGAEMAADGAAWIAGVLSLVLWALMTVLAVDWL